jgi:hypothetical protein
MRHNPDHGIMTKLMERDTVKMRCALESFEPRQADVVAAGPVVGFAMSFANVCP